MIRRLPLIPTLVVLAAVAVMIRLGFWQLDRLNEKEELLARYAAAQVKSADVPWPRSDAETESALYRHSRIDCLRVGTLSSIAGQNAKGQAGLAHVTDCDLADGGKARVVLGWSKSPKSPVWAGGAVSGIIGPGPKLVADSPLAGLEANARPDPASIPNNHLAYAVQWFLFALVALVIYGLALRKRLTI